MLIIGISRFNQVQADQFLGSQADASPFGKIWYVDVTNGSDGNAGDAPDQAFASIGQAITAGSATRGDHVVIYPGTYTITSALSPKAFMTFKAAVLNPQAPSVSVRGNLATLVNVDVDGTRWIGVEFRATGTTARDLVRLADTTAITGGVTFEDCVFHGADQSPGSSLDGVCGLWVADPTNAVTGLVVRRCLFRDLGHTHIDVGVNGMPYGKIEDNVFAIDTPTGGGIFMADTAAFGTGKGYIIRNNEFLGPDAGTSGNLGIVIAGTQDATSIGIIRTNYFAFIRDVAVTQDKVAGGVINNYLGNNAGGVLVDPSAGA